MKSLVTDEMVGRFLGWKLPENFAPDCYISFDRESAKKNNGQPTGTNLLHAGQAREMLEYVLQAKEKIAPVQGWPQGIPWSLHMEAYAVYSKKWSPQPALIDLEGRNCRGGFGVGELDEFIPGWRERVSELTAVKAQRDALQARVDELENVAPKSKALLEHSGCGHGTQVEQLTVRLNPGDKVVLVMGPYSAAMAKNQSPD